MVKINLLPIREILRKRELKQFALFAGAAVASVIAITIVAYLYLSWTISGYQKRQTGLQTELAQLKQQNKEIEDRKNRITRLQKQVDTIERLTKTRDTPAPFMKALSMAIPDEVWVTGITKSGRSFTLDGTGVDSTAVVHFVERLQKIRQDVAATQQGTSSAEPNDKGFFSDVNLIQVLAGSATGTGPTPGLGSMSFKITGNIR
jgi:type IV pilus assembly protein PilN